MADTLKFRGLSTVEIDTDSVAQREIVIDIEVNQLSIGGLGGVYKFYNTEQVDALIADLTAGESSTVEELQDVSFTGLASGDILSYNGTSWVNASVDVSGSNFEDLANVNFTSLTAGEYLYYNGTQWVNASVDHSKWDNVTGGISHSGNVGIGTSNPAVNLHIASATGTATPTPTEVRIATTSAAENWSSTDPWGRLSFYSIDASGNGPKAHAAIDTISAGTGGGASSLDFKVSGTGANLASAMRIDSSGNVGIGTNNPGAKLEVSEAGATDGVLLKLDNAVNAAGTEAGLSILQNSTSQLQCNLLTDRTGTNAGVDFKIELSDSGGTVTERFRIDEDGNVGIGATTPPYKLTVYSTSPSFNRAAQFNTNTSQSLIGLGNSSGNGELCPEIGSNQSDLVFNTQNNERMRIASNGNVGIGDSSPNVLLLVNNAVNTDAGDISNNSLGNIFLKNIGGTRADGNLGNGIAFSGINTGRRRALIASYQDGTDGDPTGLAFYTYSRTAASFNDVIQQMVIASNGNVGIGTSLTSNARLAIGGTNQAGKPAIDVSQYGANIANTSDLRLSPNSVISSSNSVNLNIVNGPFTVNQGGADNTGLSGTTELFRITSQGKVGIGTSNPSSKLEVNGTVTANAFVGDGSGLTNLPGGSGGGSSLWSSGTGGIYYNVGNVGIGVSDTTPANPLEIQADDSFSTYTSGQISIAGAGFNSQYRMGIGVDTSNSGHSYIQAAIGGSTTRNLNLNPAGGNVGIGTNNPAEKLTVDGTILTTNAPYSSNVNVAYLIAGTPNYTGATTNWGTRGFQHRFKSNSAGTPRVTIDTGSDVEAFSVLNNGNIGIGTDAPAYKLHVAGDIKLADTGTIWFDDTAGTIEKITATGSSIDIYSDALVNFYESDNSSLSFTVNTNNARAYFQGDSDTYWYRAAANEHAWTVAGSERMRLDSSGRLLLGMSSAGFPDLIQVNGDIRVNGQRVGEGGGSPGNSVAFGDGALDSNTTGAGNAAIGYETLQANTNATDNTAVGYQALKANTTGSFNTAVGSLALTANTTSGENSAFGMKSLNVTTGTGNSGFGFYSLLLNVGGNYNAAHGWHSMMSLTSGNSNTAIGAWSLHNATTGSGNICIGSYNSSSVYAPAFDITTQSNRVVMGSSAVTNAYIKVAWTVTSDQRDKMNFGSVPHGVDFVKQLNPVSYQFKVDRDTETPNGPVRYGFKAQDILALEGETPVIIDNEDPDNLRYNGEALVPVLVNAIKEQQQLIEALQARLDAAGL